MESFTAKSVRGNQEIHCRINYQNEQRSGNDGKFKSLSQQAEHDSCPGNEKKSLFILNLKMKE